MKIFNKVSTYLSVCALLLTSMQVGIYAADIPSSPVTTNPPLLALDSFPTPSTEQIMEFHEKTLSGPLPQLLQEPIASDTIKLIEETKKILSKSPEYYSVFSGETDTLTVICEELLAFYYDDFPMSSMDASDFWEIKLLELAAVGIIIGLINHFLTPKFYKANPKMADALNALKPVVGIIGFKFVIDVAFAMTQNIPAYANINFLSYGTFLTAILLGVKPFASFVTDMFIMPLGRALVQKKYPPEHNLSSAMLPPLDHPSKKTERLISRLFGNGGSDAVDSIPIRDTITQLMSLSLMPAVWAAADTVGVATPVLMPSYNYATIFLENLSKYYTDPSFYSLLLAGNFAVNAGAPIYDLARNTVDNTYQKVVTPAISSMFGKKKEYASSRPNNHTNNSSTNSFTGPSNFAKSSTESVSNPSCSRIVGKIFSQDPKIQEILGRPYISRLLYNKHVRFVLVALASATAATSMYFVGNRAFTYLDQFYKILSFVKDPKQGMPHLDIVPNQTVDTVDSLFTQAFVSENPLVNSVSTPFNIDSKSITLPLTSKTLDQSPYEGALPQHFPVSKGNVGNDVLYYIIIDRFSDGDEDNNIPTYAYDVTIPLNAPNLLYPDLEETDADLDQYLTTEEELIEKRRNRLQAYYRHNLKMLSKEEGRGLYDPNKNLMGMRWGGDLQGVIDKLDYLKDLGVTKIILSPITQNSTGTGYAAHTWCLRTSETPCDGSNLRTATSYHGYNQIDWFEIDPHFRDPTIIPFSPEEMKETLDESQKPRYNILRTLLNRAKEKGIGIILDISLNHSNVVTTGDYSPDNGDIYKHGLRVARAIKIDRTNPIHNKSVSRINPEELSPEEKAKFWFHKHHELPLKGGNFETLEDTYTTVLGGGMPDIDQENEDARKYLLDSVRFWLNFNREGPNPAPIAGFRLDAVKHVPIDFWRELEGVVSSIDKNTILFGEYFDGGLEDKSKKSLDYYLALERTTMFDFSFSNIIRYFFGGVRNWIGQVPYLKAHAKTDFSEFLSLPDFKNAPVNFFNPSALEKNLKSTFSTPNADHPVKLTKKDVNSWLTFLENHDLPRVPTEFPESLSNANAYISTIRFLILARGVPLITYGAEIALATPPHPNHIDNYKRVGGDPFNRPMMEFPEEVPLDPKNPDSNTFMKFSNPRSQAIYDATKNAIALRKKYTFIRYGDTEFLNPKNSSSGDDIFMIRKADPTIPLGQDNIRLLYAYSTHGGTFEIKKDLEESSQKFKKIYFEGRPEILKDSDESYILRLEKGESAIIVFRTDL